MNLSQTAELKAVLFANPKKNIIRASTINESVPNPPVVQMKEDMSTRESEVEVELLDKEIDVSTSEVMYKPSVPKSIPDDFHASKITLVSESEPKKLKKIKPSEENVVTDRCETVSLEESTVSQEDVVIDRGETTSTALLEVGKPTTVNTNICTC